MTKRATVLAAAITVMLGTAVVQLWINGHGVDLIVVNDSGVPVEIASEPVTYGARAFESDTGCGSYSIPLSRGESWRITRGGDVLLDSSSVALPLLSSLIAVEVWLDRDGSVRMVPPYEIARPVDAPILDCQGGSR